MKASVVAYDFRELHKKSELKIAKYVCQRLPKIASDPNLVARNFKILNQNQFRTEISRVLIVMYTTSTLFFAFSVSNSNYEPQH
jgi:hypothetical protein